MLDLYAIEQMRAFANSHGHHLHDIRPQRRPGRGRHALAFVLRGLANGLDASEWRNARTADHPVRVMRLSTSELGDANFVDVVIS